VSNSSVFNIQAKVLNSLQDLQLNERELRLQQEIRGISLVYDKELNNGYYYNYLTVMFCYLMLLQGMIMNTRERLKVVVFCMLPVLTQYLSVSLQSLRICSMV